MANESITKYLNVYILVFLFGLQLSQNNFTCMCPWKCFSCTRRTNFFIVNFLFVQVHFSTCT